MVLEVLAHSRQVVDGLDTDFGELSGRADARTQKQLRRRQRTGGEDDLIGRQSADATVEVDLESGGRRTLDEESTGAGGGGGRERKSTRLHSSHVAIPYALLCLP